MKILSINNNFTNSKKTNNSLVTAPNVVRLISTLNFKGVDKFVRNDCGDTDKFYTLIKAKFGRVMLPLKGDGREDGLNRVVGLNSLKAGLYQDVLMPLLDVMDGKPRQLFVPNGIHFFGPMGVGKTYIAQQLGEHYALKGGYYKGSLWSEAATTKDLEEIFSEAHEKFMDSGKKKYTMLFFDSMDYCLYNNGYPGYKNMFINLTGDCKDRGVILLSTSDFLEKIEPVLLQNGRTNLRIPLDYVSDIDIPEMIKHYIKYDNLPVKDEINYSRITDLIKEKGLKYKPKDIEKRLINRLRDIDDYENVKLGTDEIEDALIEKPDFSFEYEQTIRLEREKIFANQLGGVYEY